MIFPALLPEKRRSWLSVGRPFHWGCFWKVLKDERSPFRAEDPLDCRRSERADQLVLEIGIAHVEAEPLHPRPRQMRAEASPLERAAEVALLGGVAQAGQPRFIVPLPDRVEDVADRLRAADRDDRDAFGHEVSPAASGERLERDLVADAFDEDDPRRRRRLEHRSNVAAAFRRPTAQSEGLGTAYNAGTPT